MSRKNEAFCIAMGRRVHTLRLELNLTAEQLAEAAEVSTQYVFDVERGKKCMGSDVLVHMAKALKVSTDYLSTGTSWPSPGCEAALRRAEAMLPIEREMMARMLWQACDVVARLGREEDSM